jgi:putative addiction module killer protein
VYYGIDGKEIVLLLCGGDKSTQDKDIRNAKKYWKEYKQDKAAHLDRKL